MANLFHPLVQSILILSGCVSIPKSAERPPLERLKNVCARVQNTQRVTGEVWLKIKSTELNGQFPATFKSDRGQGTEIEITNLIGGVEARLKVHNGKLFVQEKGKRDYVLKADQTWAGLPVVWIHSLLLGDIPCPNFNSDTVIVDVIDVQGSLLGAHYQGDEFLEFQLSGEASGDQVQSVSDRKRNLSIEFGQKFWTIGTKEAVVKLIWRKRNQQ